MAPSSRGLPKDTRAGWGGLHPEKAPSVLPHHAADETELLPPESLLFRGHLPEAQPMSSRTSFGRKANKALYGSRTGKPADRETWKSTMAKSVSPGLRKGNGASHRDPFTTS